MSVIVKGVDVPGDCDGCWHPTCNLWIQTARQPDVGNRHKDCPISPMPKKHGRFIDSDAFDMYVQELWERNEISNGDWIMFRMWLRDQETIVEKED